MFRLFATSSLLALSAPAGAQVIAKGAVTGCSKVPANRIATSVDRTSLRSDIECARAAAAVIVDPRAKRLADLDKLPAQPTPTPSPTPAPTPAPAPVVLAGLATEGDSISAKWGGNYVGLWEARHPGAKLIPLAVSGARISDPTGGNGFVQRLPALIAAKPAVVTVLPGANDLGDGQYATPEAWLAALWGYVGQVKATGAKVVVSTVLPLCFTEPNLAAYTARHAERRPIANADIRAAFKRGQIDGVVEAADLLGGDKAPCTNRALWKDGIHPSDGNGKDGGQDKLYEAFAKVVDPLLAGGAVPAPVPAPATGDTTEQLPTGVNVVGEPAEIPSNFNTAALIEPTNNWPGGNKGEIAPSAAPDVVGAFRFICSAGPLKYDDPLVFPGQPGKSHLHQPFGNTGFNANSTYESLRTSGDSTCDNRLNRSAYWQPAMLDGIGNVVRPDYVSVYYKRRPASDPECARQGKACVDFPRGIRFIFGYDMVTGQQPTGAYYFNCQGPTATPGEYRDLPTASRFCGPGNQLGVVIHGPDCWDGVRLDTPNHRDHMAYGAYRNLPNGETRYTCDAAHPYVIPTFTLGSWYSTGDVPTGQPGSVATWSASSDEMNMGGKVVKMTGGTTWHADWFPAWDDPTLRTWITNCINKLLNCSGGNLGNGTALKPDAPMTYVAEPRLVPIPPRP